MLLFHFHKRYGSIYIQEAAMLKEAETPLHWAEPQATC